MDLDMGLAPGGSIAQEIATAREAPSAWEMAARSRCFVHLANSLAWRAIAGQAPPTVPPSAADYARAGLPWFDWYGDGPAREGSDILSRMKSLFTLAQGKGAAALPENEGFAPPRPVRLRPALREPLDGGW
jgi:hypothetical protein